MRMRGDREGKRGVRGDRQGKRGEEGGWEGIERRRERNMEDEGGGNMLF